MSTRGFRDWYKHKNPHSSDLLLSSYEKIAKERIKYNKHLLYYIFGRVPKSLLILVTSILLSSLFVSLLIIDFISKFGVANISVVLFFLISKPIFAFSCVVIFCMIPIITYVLICTVISQFGDYSQKYNKLEKELNNDK